MSDHATIIASWPRPFLRTFSEDVGVPYGTAQIWRHRNSIPADCWDDVVEAAVRRGIKGVTLELLQAGAVKRKRVRLGNAQSAVAA